MVLYRPGGFTQTTLDEPYRMRGWTQSWGCSGTQYRYGTPPGWKCDPSYPEVNGGVGTHGGCSSCLMIELQVVANYQTEVTFVSNPPGAQIFIDGIEWWQGVVTAADGATFRGISPGTHTYELRIAGYQSATGTFGLALNTPVIVTGTLIPPCVPNWQCEQPLNDYEADGCGNRRANPACSPPQTGSISFTSTPSGAEIFINGADQGVMTPNTATNVPAGDHAYVLKLAGYNDYSGTVSVVSGQTVAVTATMIAACTPVWKCELPLNGYETDGCGNRRANPACNPPQTGSISFASTPPGAGIFLDGHDQGAITPNTVSGIPAGTHAYTLRLPGYNDYTGSIDVVLNQTASVTATMIASCTPVWKCEFPLDGYESDGCGNRRLNPACNPPQIGNISFASTPLGAEIYIDGTDQNIKTPATIFNVPLGTHTYTLKQTGYNDVNGTANVGLNQTAVASATLTPVARPGIGTGTIMALLLATGALGMVILRSRKETTIVARPSGGR